MLYEVITFALTRALAALLLDRVRPVVVRVQQLLAVGQHQPAERDPGRAGVRGIAGNRQLVSR